MSQNSNSDLDPSKNTQMSSKELHDRWLEQKPEGASHPEDCPFCLLAKQEDTTGGAGVSMSDKTHTAEELAAAVALATKELQDQVRDLQAAQSQDEVASKVAEAVAETEAKLADAQAALDIAVAEKAAADQKVADVEAYLAAEKAAADEAVAVEARKAERIETVKEAASFTDEYVAQHADRWAQMAQEDFDALVDGIKTVAPKQSAASDDKIPGDTKLSSASEIASQGQGEASGLSTILDLRRAGIDARRL